MNTFLNFVKSRRFLVVVGIVVAVLVVVGYGYPAYKGWSGRKGVENLVKALEQAEKEDYKLALADTYGGKTPQETLDMFIKAVEEGDYELASKYFIIPKQEEWEVELLEINKVDKINVFIEPIKKERSVKGILSKDEDSYSIYGQHVINFLKYPSGNWKIEDF